ncbi:MBL fold metallo-hydrolase [Conexibacter sp. S30A1]|uniref:MBL fold metallo-hydrolase n=1 Tax=Conexibacter sp. S30A1 TaxID=2937800 RepID=UPI00200EA9F9|nr:MBL fold metallo-hydrolase [Conexibacter sp. S30A1]
MRAPEPGDGTGIYRVELPTSFPVGPVNSYLIEDDPLTLVDAGPNAATTLVALEDGVAALGHKINEIELIIVTHQHLDHIGLVGLLAEKTGAEVAALQELQPWLASYDQSIRAQHRYMRETLLTHGVPRDICLVVDAMNRRSSGWGAPVNVTIPLVPGQELRLGTRTFTVLHRPGHSPSDTVFCDYDARVMIGGDHLLGHISSNPVLTRPLDGREHRRPQALATYLDSLGKTATEPIDVVYSGHGDPVHAHAELIKTRVEMHRRRCERLLELIEARPRTAFELARELWPDEAVRQVQLTISEVLGHVDLLINAGDVFELQGEGGQIEFLRSH